MQRLLQDPIGKVIKGFIEQRGGSRAIANLTFFADRRLEVIAHGLERPPSQIETFRRRAGILPFGEPAVSAADVLSYLAGVSVGRWDLRAAGVRESPLGDLFDPVPIYPPGILLDGDLPARSTPPGYELDLPPGQLLFDQPGHSWDIVERVHAVAALLVDDAERLLTDVLKHLKGKDLRDHLRKHFFKDHLKRYTKSRRKAPIYWPLYVPSGAWGVWVYAPALSRETLYQIEAAATARLNAAGTEISRLRRDQQNGGRRPFPKRARRRTGGRRAPGRGVARFQERGRADRRARVGTGTGRRHRALRRATRQPFPEVEGNQKRADKSKGRQASLGQRVEVGGRAVRTMRELLADQLARKVQAHGLVIWVDREGEYADVASSIAPEGVRFEAFDGSWYELRRRIESAFAGERRSMMVVYTPAAVEEDPLAEIRDAGAEFKRRLSTLVRQCLTGRLPLSRISAIAENARTLSEAEAAVEGSGETDVRLVGVLGARDPIDMLIDILTGAVDDRLNKCRCVGRSGHAGEGDGGLRCGWRVGRTSQRSVPASAPVRHLSGNRRATTGYARGCVGGALGSPPPTRPQAGGAAEGNAGWFERLSASCRSEPTPGSHSSTASAGGPASTTRSVLLLSRASHSHDRSNSCGRPTTRTLSTSLSVVSK